MEYLIETRVYRVAGTLLDGSADEVQVYNTRRGVIPGYTDMEAVFEDISQKARDEMEADTDRFQDSCEHDMEEWVCINCGKEAQTLDDDYAYDSWRESQMELEDEPARRNQ